MAAKEESQGTQGGDLTRRKCVPCEGGTPPLSPGEIERLLKQLKGWKREGPAIAREFKFKDFHETMAFVNAVAGVAHRENHHPDMEVGYNRCLVRFSTHATGGLSENDFIAAAKVDALG